LAVGREVRMGDGWVWDVSAGCPGGLWAGVDASVGERTCGSVWMVWVKVGWAGVEGWCGSVMVKV
jgi:hypothetical protein